MQQISVLRSLVLLLLGVQVRTLTFFCMSSQKYHFSICLPACTYVFIQDTQIDQQKWACMRACMHTCMHRVSCGSRSWSGQSVIVSMILSLFFPFVSRSLSRLLTLSLFFLCLSVCLYSCCLFLFSCSCFLFSFFYFFLPKEALDPALL